MSTELRVPDVGESIQEVQIARWLKREGDHVAEDENVVELETEKASMELPSPVAGILKIVKKEGQSAAIGETIAHVDDTPAAAKKEAATDEAPAAAKPKKEAEPEEKKQRPQPAAAEQPDDEVPDEDEEFDEEEEEEQDESVAAGGKKTARPTPSARRALREYGLSAEEVEAAGKKLRRSDVLRHVEQQKKSTGNGQQKEGATVPTAEKPARRPAESTDEPERESAPDRDRLMQVVPMTMIRRRIAERLVEAQSNAALLTTFNEIDMSAVMALRKEFGERFRERYGVKLGIMSFFVKAVVDALKEVPELNAEIRGTNIVYHYRYDIGIAIGSEHGLVVPVLRSAERLSFAEIEKSIADLASRANSKKLSPRELTGGTFTISNGGIYGSLLSTPIVNPPQSGVLGMHTIQDRPVARDGQMVIRPMMYVALTYDHRIIDGREAVQWLRRVKEAIEQPARMLIEA